MISRTKVWLAGSAMVLGVALNWSLLTGHTSVPTADKVDFRTPIVGTSHAVVDRRDKHEDLENLRTTIETLQDTVKRLNAAVDRSQSRIEASEALARSTYERVAALEVSLPDLAFDTSGGDPEIDAMEANRPSPEPDGVPAAHDETDPIGEAAERFYAQRVDDRKTNDVISLIEQQMAQGAFGKTDSISTECNSSTCRAVVQHESGEDALQFDLDLPLVVGKQFDSFIARRTDLGDGYYETEIYMGNSVEP